jgi:hypothetical protein
VRSAPQLAQQQHAGESHQCDPEKHEQHDHRHAAQDRAEGIPEAELRDQDSPE